MPVYKIMVIAHLLGASVWVGGHLYLMLGLLPAALRRADPGPVLAFERSFGRVGLGALAVQLATGLWLAHRWLGSWSKLFDAPTAQSHMILTKIVLLGATIGVAGYTHHKLLPRLDAARLRRFGLLAGFTTLMAVAMLALGAGVRWGGLA
jgi:putative copper export protein